MSIGSRNRILSLSTAALVLALTLPPGVSYAWNLVCGVSIGLTKVDDTNARKWDADSRALSGISYFYAAISELQRLNLRDDGTFDNPKSVMNTSQDAISVAVEMLKRSTADFAAALQIAKDEGLGDEKGLSMLNDLHSKVEALAGTFEKDRQLPELAAFQDVVRNINAFTEYGIELSMQHLDQHLSGHGKGGSDFKIQ